MKIRFLSALGFAALLVASIASALDVNALRSRAEQGDAAAQYELAMAYDGGRGVQRDLLQAAHWCSKAAEQGHAAAQNCIGSMYQFGDGVPLDEATAASWYEKAAAQGDGTGVDRVEAFKWLDLARFYTQRSENMQLKWRVRGALDELQKEMSKAQIREGKRRSKEWDANHRPK